MVIQTGLLVAGSSTVTAIVAKLKCFLKRNGELNYGCGFTDKDLQDQDEFEVIIIGAGIVGLALAREFSIRDIKVGVVEKS